jgi:hypothetical protein
MADEAPELWLRAAPPGAPLARPHAFPERRVRPPMRLGRAARRRVRAVAECVAPSRDFGFDPGAAAIEFIEQYRPYLPPILARLFPAGLALIDWLPPLVLGRLARASRLPLAERRRYYERLGRSRFVPARAAWHAVRGLVACAIYGRKEVHAALGYAPQGYLDDMTRFRRQKFGAPEPW